MADEKGTKRLVIVESATKARKIQPYLGDDYIVELEQQGVQAFAGQAIAAGAQRAALDAAARAAVARALAPVLPALVPASGAALASGGLPAAAAGAGAVVVGQEIVK